MKVLHLPTEVGGNAWGLSRAEKTLGLDSEVLVSRSSWLDYPADIKLNLQNNSSKPLKFYKLAKTFFKVRDQYDIYHFNFGSSLLHSLGSPLQLLDLPFYHANAKLFVTYNGCDARQKDWTVSHRAVSACNNDECTGGWCNDGSIDRARRSAIEKMSRHVEHMWAVNPDLLNFLPEGKSSFLPYSIAMPDVKPVRPKTFGKLKILHAPTNQVIKGTKHLYQALKRLEETHGDCYELLLVEGVAHAASLEIYSQADVVVDQLLIGWYGGFAVEVMLLGKPVIARIEQDDLHFIPKAMANDLRNVVLDAGPDTVYERLVWCVENRSALVSRGEGAREYASKWHDPMYVAGITREAYESC